MMVNPDALEQINGDAPAVAVPSLWKMASNHHSPNMITFTATANETPPIRG